MDRAIGGVATGAGAVTSLLSDARSIPLETESVDAVYCISVLEHIPNFSDVIADVRRVLRPGGLFVPTFDVDLRGNFQLGPASYTRLIDTLDASFSLIYPEKVVHPLRALTTDNSICPLYRHRWILEPLIAPLGRSPVLRIQQAPRSPSAPLLRHAAWPRASRHIWRMSEKTRFASMSISANLCYDKRRYCSICSAEE